MKPCLILALASLLVSHSLAFMLKNPDWSDLKVTWGADPFGPSNFVSMPRTVAEAVAKGWVREKNCSQVNGNRYIFGGDRAVMLIFNAAGNIAGLATAVPKGLPFNFPSQKILAQFQDEGDFYTINAYFTDPTTVCSASASAKLVTGDRLIFKGDSFELKAPLLQSEMIPGANIWTVGQCFWGMGTHYWADITGAPIGVNTDADNQLPIFLQYNLGKLIGFGWAFNADMKSPFNRFEYPTPEVLNYFFKEPPAYLYDPSKSAALTTLHIYMDPTPQAIFC